MTFTKWIHQCPTEAVWKQHESVRNLRAFAAGLKSRAQDLRPREETFAHMPDYLEVLSAAHRFCTDVLDAGTNALDFDVQCAVVVGLQVYLPPLRGKPFWSLELEKDSDRNSTLLCSLPQRPD